MKGRRKPISSRKRRSRRYSRRRSLASRFLLAGLVGLAIALSTWLFGNAMALRAVAAAPTDVFLVLGGSIQREIYVAELAKQHPQVPILISTGSQDPCIRLIFERAEAPIQRVWLEKCADSTFDNFFFNTALLQHWGAGKVKVITSSTHLPRAKWLAQILLGAHGIWADVETVPEEGMPANQESALKTTLDVTRSLVWAVVSQFHQPNCSNITPLTQVNLPEWQQRGFKCEHQAGLDDS